MTTKKSKSQENNWVTSWQKYLRRFIKAWKKQGLKDYEIKDEVKNMAQSQYNFIDESRPNKEKPLEEQELLINDQPRREYIDYIKKVAKTGEL